jgi:hypothetical protein
MIVIASLSGCAAGQPLSPSEPATPVQPSSPPPVADPAEEACLALSEPASMGYNAWNDLHKERIDLATSIEQLERADELFRAIDAPAGSVGIAVSNVVAYIDAAVPGPEGQPYDTGTDEFFNLTSGLASACSAAGHELIISAHGG